MTEQLVDQFRNLVFAHAIGEEKRLKETKLLAHYTSAENALNILTGGELWLRQASMMNDFREVEHGRMCLENALNSPAGKHLAERLNSTFPDLWEELTGHYETMMRNARLTTFLVSFCEHDPGDRMGALSMWRAYGGKAGVALLVDPNFAFADDDVDFAIFSSPVLYGGAPDFLTEFEAFAGRLTTNMDLAAKLPRAAVKAELFNALQFAALSTKHKGFEEEHEWRAFHLPQEVRSDHVQLRAHAIGGIPQIIAALPLRARDELPFPYTLDQCISRVIIGPSPHAIEMGHAFMLKMQELGFNQPSDRVSFSDIPLRQGS